MSYEYSLRIKVYLKYYIDCIVDVKDIMLRLWTITKMSLNWYLSLKLSSVVETHSRKIIFSNFISRAKLQIISKSLEFEKILLYCLKTIWNSINAGILKRFSSHKCCVLFSIVSEKHFCEVIQWKKNSVGLRQRQLLIKI